MYSFLLLHYNQLLDFPVADLRKTLNWVKKISDSKVPVHVPMFTPFALAGS